jgi:hypothetical protein
MLNLCSDGRFTRHRRILVRISLLTENVKFGNVLVQFFGQLGDAFKERMMSTTTRRAQAVIGKECYTRLSHCVICNLKRSDRIVPAYKKFSAFDMQLGLFKQLIYQPAVARNPRKSPCGEQNFNN